MMKRTRIAVATMAILAVTAGALGAASAMGHGHPFFGRLLNKVKAELGLTQEQEQKVEALQQRVKATFKGNRAGHKALMKEGRSLWLDDKFDEAKANAIDAERKARQEATHQVVRAAMKELHGLLTKEQRTKLVEAMDRFHAKMKARFHKWKANKGAAVHPVE